MLELGVRFESEVSLSAGAIYILMAPSEPFCTVLYWLLTIVFYPILCFDFLSCHRKCPLGCLLGGSRDDRIVQLSGVIAYSALIG